MPPAPPEDFAARLSGILNASALNLALAIGHRCGLLAALARESEPLSAAELAGRTGLDARYVREWLGAMVCGEIVEISGEGETERYLLPAERAEVLVGRNDDGLAIYCQELPLLTSSVYEQVLQAFQTGHGIPYSSYPDFQTFMAELAATKHRRQLLDQFLPAVDDGRLIERLRSGIRVCDFGCGEGVALVLMATAFPDSEFVGIDIDWEALAVARKNATRFELPNLEFSLHDASELRHDRHWAGRFDYVTAFDAIHDQRAPLEALQSVHHLLAADGLFSMVDIAACSSQAGNREHPLGAFLYTVSLMHCLPVGLVGGGAGLGMMWGREQAAALLAEAGFAQVEVGPVLAEAGFAQVEVGPVPGDPFNLHYLCRR